MLVEGEIRHGMEIGKAAVTAHFIWQSCSICNKPRWALMCQGQAKYDLCCSCGIKYNRKISGSNHSAWRGGRQKGTRGYINCWISSNDFFYPMARNKNRGGGRVVEHRLVMAKHLNRCLLDWEVVHHKNGIKDDNRLENLALLSGNSSHNKELNKQIKILKQEVAILQNRVTLLEVENVRLATLVTIEKTVKLD